MLSRDRKKLMAADWARAGWIGSDDFDMEVALVTRLVSPFPLMFYHAFSFDAASDVSRAGSARYVSVESR